MMTVLTDTSSPELHGIPPIHPPQKYSIPPIQDAVSHGIAPIKERQANEFGLPTYLKINLG
jgi:hypothetical protein